MVYIFTYVIYLFNSLQIFSFTRLTFFSLINFFLYTYIHLHILFSSLSWKWEGSIFCLFVLCRKGFRYETCFTLGSGGGRAGTVRTRNDGTCVHMKWNLILFETTLKIMKNINLQLFHISLRSWDIYTCVIFKWDDLWRHTAHTTFWQIGKSCIFLRLLHEITWNFACGRRPLN